MRENHLGVARGVWVCSFGSGLGLDVTVLGRKEGATTWPFCIYLVAQSEPSRSDWLVSACGSSFPARNAND